MLRDLAGFSGRPIRIRFAPDLRASRGTLFSGVSAGAAVHAATFLRKREIVLESALLKTRPELVRILLHELFHFVWLRLGNGARGSYGVLIADELGRGARGELGWSAESRKRLLTAGDLARSSRRWREYVCESFCDSAAWLLGGARRHAERTLAARHRERRRRCLLEIFGERTISI